MTELISSGGGEKESTPLEMEIGKTRREIGETTEYCNEAKARSEKYYGLVCFYILFQYQLLYSITLRLKIYFLCERQVDQGPAGNDRKDIRQRRENS